MDKNMKWWREKTNVGLNNATEIGMSSANGCTKEDLPLDVNPGSTAYDYTKQEFFTFDGKGWN